MDSLPELAKSFLKAIGEMLYVAGLVVCQTCDLVFSAEELARRYRWCLSLTWPAPFIIYLGRLAKVNTPRRHFENAIVHFYTANDYGELVRLIQILVTYQCVPSRRKATFDEIPEVVRAAARGEFNAATWLLPRLFIELEGILRDYAKADLVEASPPGSIVTSSVQSLTIYATRLEKPALRVITRHLFRNTRRRRARQKSLSRNLHLHGILNTRPALASVIQVLLFTELVASLIDRRRGVSDGLNGRRLAGARILALAVQKGRAIQDAPSLLYRTSLSPGSVDSGPNRVSESQVCTALIDRAINAMTYHP